jgi:hypothetical protein
MSSPDPREKDFEPQKWETDVELQGYLELKRRVLEIKQKEQRVLAWRNRLVFAVIGAFAAAALLFWGYELVPSQADVVFVLYRDRMKAQDLDEARSLLSDASRKLALKLAAEYKLEQPPESLALLNALDDSAAPVVIKSEEMSTLLQLRTLKGGLRLVRLIRKDSNSPWRIDILGELRSLQSFLGVRWSLKMLLSQANEYAATYYAFSNQIGKMHIIPPSLTMTAHSDDYATKSCGELRNKLIQFLRKNVPLRRRAQSPLSELTPDEKTLLHKSDLEISMLREVLKTKCAKDVNNKRKGQR